MNRNQKRKERKMKKRNARQGQQSASHPAAQQSAPLKSARTMNDASVLKQGMDLKHWVQRALRNLRLNLTATTTQAEFMLCLAADLNGYTIRLYSYDNATDSWAPDSTLDPDVGGRHLWGDTTGQYERWAMLYELYRNGKAKIDLVPSTFAAYGQQSGTLVLKDPIGYYAAILKDNFTFPNGNWRTSFSDAKGSSIHQGFKRVTGHIDWNNLLVSQVDKPILRTVDSSSLTGQREVYTITSIAASGTTEGNVPALCFFMPFELEPSLFGVERNVDIGQVEFTMDITFLQRRLDINSDAFFSDDAESSFLSRLANRQVSVGAPRVSQMSLFEQLQRLNPCLCPVVPQVYPKLLSFDPQTKKAERGTEQVNKVISIGDLNAEQLAALSQLGTQFKSNNAGDGPAVTEEEESDPEAAP